MYLVNIRDWHIIKKNGFQLIHYSDVKMGAIASQITSLAIVYSIVYSGGDKKAPKLCVTGLSQRGIHR